MWSARNAMEQGTTNDEISRAQRSRMNAWLKIALVQKNKVSPSQKIQLFMIPLKRRRQYEFVANERWLKSVEAVRQNKKHHDEKQAKKDRNICLFFVCPVSKEDPEQKKIFHNCLTLH